MWEANVVAAQVEPYVTDYGIDIVSDGFPTEFPCLKPERAQTDVSMNRQLVLIAL